MFSGALLSSVMSLVRSFKTFLVNSSTVVFSEHFTTPEDRPNVLEDSLTNSLANSLARSMGL